MSFVKRGFANIFLQRNPVGAHGYLTSTGAGDIAIPKRPRTIKYDPNIRKSGEFVATEFIKGEPGEITVALSRPLDTVQNYLQEIDCPVNARINYACRGDRNIFWNYELGIQLLGAEFEAGNIGQPVAAVPDQEDRVMTGGDLKALGWTYVYLLEGLASAGVPGADDIGSIVFLPEECGDRCGRRIQPGCEGLAGLSGAPYIYENQVIKTVDCNSTWEATDEDPFGGDRDVTAFVTVETATGVRVIAAGEGVAGEFPEIAYLDVTYQTDLDAEWQTVVVSGVVGMGINSLTVAPDGTIYAAATGGYVYSSNNIGLTWEESSSGLVAGEDFNDIVFVNTNLGFVVGNANAIIGTTNAGSTWAVYVGPAAAVNLTSIDVNRSGYLFVTAADATLHRSIDAANSWVQIMDMLAGTMNKIRFDPELAYYGYLIWDNADPVGTLLRSEDGGVSWLALATPANTGLNDLYVVDPNMAYVAGNAAFIAKFDRASS